MAIIVKPSTFSAGQIIIASQHNSNFDTIYTDYNGNITNANISPTAAIADSKLASITTAGKVNISALVATNQIKGDILYYTGTVWARLGTGAIGTYLTVSSGLPYWL